MTLASKLSTPVTCKRSGEATTRAICRTVMGATTTMDYNLHLALEAGATGELYFTPREAGEYVFFCSVTGHQESGMLGTLIVAS